MKKLVIGIGGLVAILVVVALVAPFLIPTDTYRNQLVSLVNQATGRDLNISGPVRLSFLPQIEVEANDVSLSNAPGASAPEMLKLKQLQVQLRFLPLLHGAVELGRFVLDQPEISLEVDKNGKPNWAFAPAAAAPTTAAPAAPAPAAPAGQGFSGALSSLRLEDVRLVQGKISFQDDRSGSTQEVDDINVKLSLLGLDTPLEVDGSATWHGEKLAINAGIHKPSALLAGDESGFDIKVDGQPLTVSLAGSITGLPPAKIGGTIDLTVPSVRGLAKWAGATLPSGGGLEKLAIKGKIDMEGPKVAFTDAAISIDAITAQGSLTVDTSGARPYLKGSLAVDKLDVNPYLPPQTNTAAGQPAAAPAVGSAAGSAAGWSDAPIDDSALGAADADFDLKSGSILYRKIAVGPSAAAVHLKSSKLDVDLSQLSLYQGQGHGKISVDGSGATPSIALDFSLAGLQVEPLLTAAAGTDRLSGTGKLTLNVTGSGKSQRALINALNGKGALDLTNGQLKGVNLIALAENATSPLSGVSGDNRTDFGSMTGTFTIINGIAHNNDLQLKSGIIPITGTGTVDLPNRTVDYKVTVSLAGAIGVPVLITGPWDNISYRPDLAGALQGAVQKPRELLNQLRSLGAAGAGAGASGAGAAVDKLKGLFGK
jgi:AsmA protein